MCAFLHPSPAMCMCAFSCAFLLLLLSSWLRPSLAYVRAHSQCWRVLRLQKHRPSLNPTSRTATSSLRLSPWRNVARRRRRWCTGCPKHRSPSKSKHTYTYTTFGLSTLFFCVNDRILIFSFLVAHAIQHFWSRFPFYEVLADTMCVLPYSQRKAL